MRPTVQALNSCTKYSGSLGIKHDRIPHCHPGSWAGMTSQLNVALIRKLRGSLMRLDYFLTCYPWVFVRPDTGRRPVDWCRNWISAVQYFLHTAIISMRHTNLCSLIIKWKSHVAKYSSSFIFVWCERSNVAVTKDLAQRKLLEKRRWGDLGILLRYDNWSMSRVGKDSGHVMIYCWSAKTPPEGHV